MGPTQLGRVPARPNPVPSRRCPTRPSPVPTRQAPLPVRCVRFHRGRRRTQGLPGGWAWGFDDEDPGGGDGRHHQWSSVAGHAELDASLLAGASEAGGILEDPHDFGGWEQDDRPAPAGALGVGGEDLHAVARPQPLGHVALVDLDRQLDQVGLLAGGEHDPGRDERLATDGCGEDPTRHLLTGTRLQVVSQRRCGEADPDHDEVPFLQRCAGGQVVGGHVHGSQLL